MTAYVHTANLQLKLVKHYN